MNYGLIPVNVCETLYRESGKFGGGAVSKKGSPFFFILLVSFHGLLCF